MQPGLRESGEPPRPTPIQDEPNPRRDPRSLGAVIVASLAFATSAPLARVAKSADPLVIAAGRVALASIVLLLVDPLGLLRTARTMRPRVLGHTALAGVLLGAHFALFQAGLDATSLPAAASLVSLEPLGVVLVAWARFGLRPSARESMGVAVATAGALVVAQGSGSGGHTLRGDALVLGAVVLYGFYVAQSRALRDDVPTKHYAPLVYGFAGLTLLGLLAALSPDAPLPDARAMGAIVALGFVPTVVGHTLVQYAARHTTPALVALVSPGETLGSIAIASALLGEQPSLLEAAGGGVILAGAMLAATLRETSKETHSEEPSARRSV